MSESVHRKEIEVNLVPPQYFLQHSRERKSARATPLSGPLTEREPVGGRNQARRTAAWLCGMRIIRSSKNGAGGGDTTHRLGRFRTLARHWATPAGGRCVCSWIGL